MTILCTAGPRTRLQLIRVPVRLSGDANQKYQVRVIDDVAGVVTLSTSRRYQVSRTAFEIEAAWRGWSLRTPRTEAA